MKNIGISTLSTDAEEQYHLGLLYEKGIGVVRDYAQAFKWFKKSAEQGHPDAQYDLGLMYSRGRGVTQNSDQATKWFKKAAEQEHLEAQSHLRV